MHVVEAFYSPGDCEEKRAQAHDREEVRAVDDEWIRRYGQYRRNGINGKDDVGRLYDDEHKDQGRREEHVLLPYEELAVLVLVREGDKALQEPYEGVLLRVQLLVLRGSHLYPGEDEEGAEYVDYPVELRYEGHAREYEYRPHYDGAEHAPEEYLVLVDGRDAEE